LHKYKRLKAPTINVLLSALARESVPLSPHAQGRKGAWSPLATTPDSVIFHLLEDDIKKLFHHLLGNRDEADWPVVSQLLLFAHFKNWCASDYPPVFRHLSLSPWSVKHDTEWFSNHLCQLPQHSWVHLIRACGFVCSNFAYMIPDQVFLDQGKYSFPHSPSYLQGLRFSRGSLRCRRL